MRFPSGRRSGALLLTCLLVAVLCAACGSRRSHQELLAAAHGPGGTSEVGIGAAGTTGGEDAGSAADPQAAAASGGTAGSAGSAGRAGGSGAATGAGAAAGGPARGGGGGGGG